MVLGVEVGFLERVRGQTGYEFLRYPARWAFNKDLTAIGLGILVSPRRVDNVRQSLSGTLELDFNVHCGRERAGRRACVERDLHGRPDWLNGCSEASENVSRTGCSCYCARKETVVCRRRCWLGIPVIALV